MKASKSPLAIFLASVATAIPAPRAHTFEPSILAPRQSAGSAIVHNYCTFTTYLRVTTNTQGPLITLSSGSSYSGTYQTRADGGGISISVDKSDPASTGTPVQLQYTLQTTSGLVYYSLSTVRGDPFLTNGFEIVPSVASCPTLDCPKGQNPCKQALPSKSQPSSCQSSASLTLKLCQG